MAEPILVLKSALETEPKYTGTENAVGSGAQSCPFKETEEKPPQKILDVYFASPERTRIEEIANEDKIDLIIETENMEGEDLIIDLPENLGDFKFKNEEITEDKVILLEVGSSEEKLRLEVVAKKIDIEDDPPSAETNAKNGQIGPKEVLDACFAEKEIEGKNVTFKRVDIAILGQEIYLVVKTKGLQGQTIKIKVRQAKESVLGDLGKPISVEQDDKDVTLIKSTVGQFAKENKKLTNHKEFEDWAIAKINLGPKKEDTANSYSNSIDALTAKMTYLDILVDAHHSEENITYHGAYPKGTSSGAHKNVWLNKAGNGLKLVSYTMHIYSTGKISKLNLSNTKKARFKYHDNAGNIHDLGTFNVTQVQKWKRGSKMARAGWKKASGKYYQYDKGKTPLIKIRFPLNHSAHGVTIKLADNTTREYINPEAYACLLGAIAEDGYTDITFNGFTSKDGTGAPSVTHYNGLAGDLRYLRKDKSGAVLYINNNPDDLDIGRQEKLIDALVKFGWSGFYSYKIKINKKDFILKKCTHLSHHHHHLHLKKEGFSPNYI